MCRPPQAAATRLIDSVVPRVKTISSALAGIKELRGAFARGLVRGGRAVGEFVDAAVDVAVIVLVVAADGVDHLPRPLAAGAAVEIDERVAMHLLVEDGEIAPACGPVHQGVGRRGEREFSDGLHGESELINIPRNLARHKPDAPARGPTECRRLPTLSRILILPPLHLGKAIAALTGGVGSPVPSTARYPPGSTS